jgi:hypothetical protein
MDADHQYKLSQAMARADLQKFEASFEPLTDIPGDLHIRIDTEKSVKKNIQQILSSDYDLLSEKPIAEQDAGK